MRRLPKIALTLVLCGVTSTLSAQSTPKKRGPTVQELQQKVIDLQGQLLACQAGTKAATPDPVKEAREAHTSKDDAAAAEIKRQRSDAVAALRALSSIYSGGGTAPDFKQYYLAAKVKVDTLPPSEEFSDLRQIGVMCGHAYALVWSQMGRNQLAESDYDTVVGTYGCSIGIAGRFQGNVYAHGNGVSVCAREIMGRVDAKLAGLR